MARLPISLLAAAALLAAVAPLGPGSTSASAEVFVWIDERGVTHITVVPTMLTPGGSHSEIEIPEILEDLRGRHPSLEIRYAWPTDLGLMARMLADHLKTFEG